MNSENEYEHIENISNNLSTDVEEKNSTDVEENNSILVSENERLDGIEIGQQIEDLQQRLIEQENLYSNMLSFHTDEKNAYKCEIQRLKEEIENKKDLIDNILQFVDHKYSPLRNISVETDNSINLSKSLLDCLIQNAYCDEYNSLLTNKWLCKALFDFVTNNNLNSNLINKVFEILNKILTFLNDDQNSLNLVEKMLSDVKNEKSSSKYELMYHFMLLKPNRKFNLIQIFIRDLEYLIINTKEHVLDVDYQQNNPEMYSNIKKILEMLNYTVEEKIDLDTIEVLKKKTNLSE